MKQTVLLLLFITVVCGCKQQPKEQDTAPEGYTLVWSDEFDQDGRPDAANWTYENGFVRNREHQWYQPENAYVKDGRLVIEAKRESRPNPLYEEGSRDWRKERELVEYTSACVKTVGLHDWLYGVFEVKAKIPAYKGSWPAIWFLGNRDVGPWPLCGEIDLMEYYRVKDEATILANACWANGTWDTTRWPMTHFEERDPTWADKFHIWKMEWDKDFIRLYLDDELLNEVDLAETLNPDGTNPFHHPQYILLNLAIGGINGGDPSETAFPLFYEIDYVRVYQKKE